MGAPVPLKVAEYHHWFPVGALLYAVYPVLVTTGAAGIGLTVTAKFGETVPFPHELVPVTENVPDSPVGEKLTVIELVLAPLVIVAASGMLQR